MNIKPQFSSQTPNKKHLLSPMSSQYQSNSDIMNETFSMTSRVRERRRQSEVQEVKLKRKLHPIFEGPINEVK